MCLNHTLPLFLFRREKQIDTHTPSPHTHITVSFLVLPQCFSDLTSLEKIMYLPTPLCIWVVEEIYCKYIYIIRGFRVRQ